MTNKTKSRILLGMSVGFALMAAILCWLLHSWGGAAQTPPSPRILSPTQGDTADPSLTITSDASSSTGEDDASEAADDGFPTVDWAYWQGVSPDVIGWITVPGTTINSPIVQAPTDDPDFYLSHDVYGNYNVYGAIYLDAECVEAGLDSRNAVILGHHSGNLEAAPFGVIQEYADETFAAGHATILLQTPEWKRAYEVRFAQIVNGLEPSKRTVFHNNEDFRMWYDAMRMDASMTLDGTMEPEQAVSLVSCSYYVHPENERTVVVASESGGDQMVP